MRNSGESELLPPAYCYVRLGTVLEKEKGQHDLKLTRCFNWYSLGDSNPCYRRERAAPQSLRPALNLARF